MALIRWKPFNLFETMLEHHTWDLAVDVYEDDGNVVAKMHVPGVTPDDIEINIEDDHLHIHGERKHEKEINEKDYYKKEICCGSFERVIPLPCAVQEDSVTAHCKNGVLTITMVKSTAHHKAGKKIKVTQE